jgi:methionyl-tRNA formyltransferase
MYMDRGVDTGDMILAERVPIGPDETGAELHDRLSEAGGRLLVATLERIAAGTAPRTPQSGEGSYAARLEKEHGWIDWSLAAGSVHNHARALTPWPGATLFHEGQPVVVVKTRVVPEPVAALSPGTVIGIFDDALRVACGSGAVDLLEVRPSGRGTMTGAEFARGRRLEAGTRLESRP